MWWIAMGEWFFHTVQITSWLLSTFVVLWAIILVTWASDPVAMTHYPPTKTQLLIIPTAVAALLGLTWSHSFAPILNPEPPPPDPPPVICKVVTPEWPG